MYSKQLESFVRAAEEGSFSKAARLLYMAPASLIQQINLFESRLGLTLFDRGPRGIKLTDAGEALYHDAVEIMRMANASLSRARAIQEGCARVRIGTSLRFKCRTLTDVAARFVEERPDVRVELVPITNPAEASWKPLPGLGVDYDMLEGLYLSELHGGRCNFLETQRVALLPAMPKNHPLYGKETLKAKDLAGYEVILLRRGMSRTYDELRDDLLSIPDIALIDVPFYGTNVFTSCEINRQIIMLPEVWQDIHPQLHIAKFDRLHRAPYGILYAKDIGESSRILLSLLEQSVSPNA